MTANGEQRTANGEPMTVASVIPSEGGTAAAVEGSAFPSLIDRQIPPLRDCCAIAPVGMTGAWTGSQFAVHGSLLAVLLLACGQSIPTRS